MLVIESDDIDPYRKNWDDLFALQEELKICLSFDCALQALILACYRTYNQITRGERLDVNSPEYILYPSYYAKLMMEFCKLSGKKLEEVLNREWVRNNILAEAPSLFEEFITRLKAFVVVKEKYLAVIE